MYIPLPPGVGAKQLDISITSTQLTVGIKGNPPYLNVRIATVSAPPTATPQHPLEATVKPAESFWTVDDGQLHIQLTKAIQVRTHVSATVCSEINLVCLPQAQSWAAALQGHQLDQAALETERQRLMLERFQAEVLGAQLSHFMLL